MPVLVMPPSLAPPVSAVARVTLLPLVSNVPPPVPIAASWPEMSVLVPAAHCRPPPLSAIVPVPKLLAEEKLIAPPLIVHEAAVAAVLLSAQVLAPAFWKALKFRYWALLPIEEE